MSAELDRETPQEECIVVGYRLHNLYNAFENIFRNVARAFENTLEELYTNKIDPLRMTVAWRRRVSCAKCGRQPSVLFSGFWRACGWIRPRQAARAQTDAIAGIGRSLTAGRQSKVNEGQ